MTEPSETTRRWFYFCTPLHSFACVMVPILGLMAVLAISSRVPIGIRLTAAVVILVSLQATWRGYLHRLVCDAAGVRLQSPLQAVSIPWRAVRRIDRYIPPDRNRLTQYVYITSREVPPGDRHEQNAEVVQLQDRPGLLEALQEQWRASR